MNLIARAIEKASIDENHPLFGRTNTFFQIDRRAAFFIHNPHFHGQGRQAKHRLHSSEQRIGESHFFGPVHFRFHDIDRPGRAVFQRGIGFAQIMLGKQTGDQRVHNAFGHFVATIVQNRRIGHQMPDIADQHGRQAG